jgi:hypothetical protein
MTAGLWVGPSGAGGLGPSSVVARLLGLWARIPPEGWMLPVVSVVCCQIEVCATS